MQGMIRQSGASLLEVLIASAIALTGISGFTQLQSSLMRTDELLLYQNAAQQLIERKVIDLKQFDSIRFGENSYQSIATNNGGRIPAGEHLHPVQSDVSLSLTLNWRVERVYLLDTDNDGVKDTWLNEYSEQLPDPAPQVPSMKLIRVSVHWHDHDDGMQALAIETLISPTIGAGRLRQLANNSI